MKVTNNPLSTTGLENTKATSTATRPPAADKAGKKAPVSSEAGGVEISDQARLMKEAREIVYGAPDIQADKVSDIKRRVKDGSYKVDAQAVADRLVDEHLASNFGKNNL